MARARWFVAVGVGAALVGSILLAGCGDGGAELPRLSLKAAPAGGIGSYRGGTALWVVEVGSSMAGDAIEVTATSVNGVPCEVRPARLRGPGRVEVIARPQAEAPLGVATVTVGARAAEGTAAAGVGEVELALPLHILDFEDRLGTTARRRFRPFITYLAARQPALGIDRTTAWEGWDPVPNILVVMWYSFLSDDHEALIRWHVMIPPYDWTEVFVRRRGSLDCVWAGRIPTDGAAIEETEPPQVFPRFGAPIIDLN